MFVSTQGFCSTSAFMLKRFQVVLLLLLLITGLVLRKTGVPGGLYVIMASGLLLVVHDFLNGIRKFRLPTVDINTRSALTEFAFGTSMLLVVCTQMNWTGKHVSATIALFLMLLVTFSFLEKYISRKRQGEKLPRFNPVRFSSWIVILTLTALTAVFNPRQFHNFFYSTRFEAALRE